MDVYNQTVDGEVASTVTAAVGGGKHKWSKGHRVPSKLGGARGRLLRQESRERCADPMGTERDSGCQSRSDIICLVYESHNQDSRYRPLGDICETVSAKYGTGGGNQPIVLRYELPESDRMPESGSASRLIQRTGRIQ